MAKKLKNKILNYKDKGRFLVKDNLKNVDLIFELVDSRAPISTRNSLLLKTIKNKLKIVVLTKADLAEKEITRLWVEKIKKEENVFSIALNCKNLSSVKQLIKISHIALKEHEKKIGKKNSLSEKFRAMVVGTPNIGKSSLINSLAKKKKAKTGNFAGVTLKQQWVAVDSKISVLDMPGDLYLTEKTKKDTLICNLLGLTNETNYDEEEVAIFLLDFLKENKKEIFLKIFNLKNLDFSYNLLKEYAKIKKMVKKGAELDIKRAANFLIKQFKQGKLGLVSLQKPLN